MLKFISNTQANFTALKSKYLKADDGATAIEYGLIAVGIALAIVLVLPNIGTNLLAAFNSVDSGLGGQGNATKGG